MKTDAFFIDKSGIKPAFQKTTASQYSFISKNKSLPIFFLWHTLVFLHVD
jgi:hypothetical protein